MLNIGSIINSVLTNINLATGMFENFGVWITELLKQLAMIISYAFFAIARAILQLIFDLANLEIFGKEAIGNLLEKVYMILSIVMLFKIVISCIQFLIDPDKIDDKKAGFGAIFKRLFISLALLVLVSPIFSFAFTIQKQIIAVFPTLFLGNGNQIEIDTPSSSDKSENSVANQMVFNTFIAFIRYNDACENYDTLKKIPVYRRLGMKTIEGIYANRERIIIGYIL